MLVLTTFTPVTAAREEAPGNAMTSETGENGENDKNGDEDSGTNLARVPCIRYPITFRKQSVSALLDSGSEVNGIDPTFAKELGLPIRPTDIGAQKIDGTTLDTYGMVVAAFSVTDNPN